MQDYHVYVHAQSGGKSATNPQYHKGESKTAVQTTEKKVEHESSHNLSGIKATGIMLGTASKINSFVGELTENVVTERRIALGLTSIGFVSMAAFGHPIGAALAAGAYYGSKAISYGIKIHKENLTANYMKQLSGGTVKMGR